MRRIPASLVAEFPRFLRSSGGARMQYPLKTLLLLPAFVGLTLSHYLFVERNRVVAWENAGQFWGQFGRDCLFMVTATVCVVGCYATLRPQDRSTLIRGLRRLFLRAAVFLVPFVAGLNVAIGYSGSPNARHAVRVLDDYSWLLASRGADWMAWITAGWHMALTALLGLAALWMCRRLDRAGHG